MLYIREVKSKKYYSDSCNILIMKTSVAKYLSYLLVINNTNTLLLRQNFTHGL